jgi:hypothetical protein
VTAEVEQRPERSEERRVIGTTLPEDFQKRSRRLLLLGNGDRLQANDMHQRHDLVAIKVGIGFRNAQPDDYGSLADQKERSDFLRDLVSLAVCCDDAERLEGFFFQLGFQVLGCHYDRFSLAASR